LHKASTENTDFGFSGSKARILKYIHIQNVPRFSCSGLNSLFDRPPASLPPGCLNQQPEPKGTRILIIIKVRCKIDCSIFEDWVLSEVEESASVACRRSSPTSNEIFTQGFAQQNGKAKTAS
jgi:hypothetical protein